MELKSIEDAKTFEEITEIREDGHRAYIRNGDNLEALLTGGYKDLTHFIFELLQNAEDVLASEVTFNLYNDMLVFSHNGKKEFDLEDIKSITGIGKTTKKQEDNKIGKFGIGFKSVFTICKEPKIYSPDFCFELRNLRVPYKINREKGFEKGTHFVLHFFNNEKSVQDIYRLLNKSINNFNHEILLFLRNIKKINFITQETNGFIEKEKKEVKFKDFTYYECKIKPNNSIGIGFNYLLFEKPLKDNEKLFISIAYQLSTSGGKSKIFLEEKTTKLVVFFPTERETFLRFKVNGPYATTSTRENLSEKYSAENEEIMKQTVSLYGDSLKCIKELGMITVDFIEKLPIENISDSNYKMFFEETKRILKTNAILPTNDGSNVSADKACIIGSSAMPELLNDEELKTIFAGSEKWLSDDITYDKTRQLRDYLRNQFGVREVDFEEFMRGVKDNFFEKRSDEWLLKFYQIAGGSIGRDSIKTVKMHLSKKFIRTETNNMCSPFTNGTKNVFLPSKINIKNTIKQIFFEDEYALKFFKDIGIEPTNTVDEIRDFLETLKNSKDEADYLVNFQLIAAEYNSVLLDKKKDIENILKNEFCLLTDFEIDRKKHRAKPTDVFMQYEGIKTIYKELPNILYINSILAEEAEKDSSFKEFLIKIGVNNSIKVLECENKLSHEERIKLRNNNSYTKEIDKSFQIEYIDIILSTMNFSTSLELWKAINNFESKYFIGFYQRFYVTLNPPIKIKSYFVTKLQNAKWLYNERNELVSPIEIYYEDILKRYPDSRIIKDNLDFKPDLRKELPQEDQIKLDLTDGIPLDVLRDFIEKYKQEQNNDTNFNPVSVDECDIDLPITEIAFDNPRSGIDIDDLESEEKAVADEIANNAGIADMINDLYSDMKTDESSELEFEKKTVPKTVSNKNEILGKWGESFVFKQLNIYYSNDGYEIIEESNNCFKAIKEDETFVVTRHNANGKIQKGYDITIKRGDEIIKYIEVKSREGEDKEYFNVSGTQWEFAKTLENRGEGNKYWVYLVTKAATNKAVTHSLCNPYKNWKDGNLEADPVSIKL